MPIKPVAQLVEEANAAVDCWPVEDALGKLNDPSIQFVDIRDIRELWRDGTIPGAHHAPRGMLEFWVDPASPYAKDIFQQEKTYVLFCASGWRSALAAKALKDMGFENVAHITGGFTAWKEAAGPVESKAQKP